jgi:hypothetical protein
MRTSAVSDIIANIAEIHQAELVCNSQVTDPIVITDSIVITLDLVDNKGHHHCSVSAGTIVGWDSTKTDTVMNADMVIEQITIILAVDTTIDDEIKMYPGAGRAAGQLTQEDHTGLTTARGLRTVDHAVRAIVASTTTENDAISLTEVETTLAEPTRWRSPQPDVCVSVDRISIVDGRIEIFRSRTLEGIGRLRHLLAIVHRRR